MWNIASFLRGVCFSTCFSIVQMFPFMMHDATDKFIKKLISMQNNPRQEFEVKEY